MNLSRNFTLAEATHSEKAIELGIPNVARNAEIRAMRYLANEVLQKARDYFRRPYVITSWFRCPDLNTAVGGADTSLHIEGAAADGHIEGVTTYTLAQWMRHHVPYEELILERLGGRSWVHVALVAGEPPARQVLTIDDETGEKRTRVGLFERGET